jgi:Phage protein (N4 Gp49/phage Sf6 gene 66) family
MTETYNKPVTEDELKARAAKSGARRISLEDVNKSIVSEHYLNPVELHPLTICVLKLENGFMVTGHSAPAILDNYDETVGRRLARDKAVAQIWMLLGYELKERMFRDREMLKASLVPAKEGFLTYIGTKVVNAQPCLRSVYCELRGWDVPTDEDGKQEGYLIEYTDKVENMLPGFQGYVSWSPKDVFERAYRSVHDLLLDQ